MLLVCICALTNCDRNGGDVNINNNHSLDAKTSEPGKPKEFIYVQRLVPRLYDGMAWTKEDKAASDRLLIRFQEATKSGQLILAGRTKEPGDKTFGIAIFRASDEAAARAFMKADPTVSAGLMTAELHPLRCRARTHESVAFVGRLVTDWERTFLPLSIDFG